MPEFSPLRGLSFENFLPDFLKNNSSPEIQKPRFSFGDMASGLAIMGSFGLVTTLTGLGVTGLTRGVFGFGKDFTSLASSLVQESGSALAFSSFAGADFKSSLFENMAQNGLMSIGSSFLSGLAGPIFPFIQSALMVTTSMAATKARVAVLGGPSDPPQNNPEISSRYLEALVPTLLLGGAGVLIAKMGKTRSYLSQLPKALGLHPKRFPNWERDFSPRLKDAQRALQGNSLERALNLATDALHDLENKRVGVTFLEMKNKKWKNCAEAVNRMRETRQGEIFQLLEKCTNHPAFKNLDPKVQNATSFKLRSMKAEWAEDAGAAKCSAIMAECQNPQIKTRLHLLGQPLSGATSGSRLEAIHDGMMTVFGQNPRSEDPFPSDLASSIKTKLVPLAEPIPEGEDPFLTLYKVIYGTPPQNELQVFAGLSRRQVTKKLGELFTEIHPDLGNFFNEGCGKKAIELFGIKHRIAATFYPREGVLIPPYIIAYLNPQRIQPSHIVTGPAHELGHTLSLLTYSRAHRAEAYLESSSSELAAFAMEGIVSSHYPHFSNPLKRLLRSSAVAELENFMRATPSPTCTQTSEKWGELLVEYGLMKRDHINTNPEIKSSWAIFHQHMIKSGTMGRYVKGQILKSGVQIHYAQMNPSDRSAYMGDVINNVWTQDLTFEEALKAYQVGDTSIESIANMYRPVST